MRLQDDDKNWIKSQITTAMTETISEAVAQAVSAAVAPLALQIVELKKIVEEKNNAITSLEQRLIASTQRNVELHSLIIEKAEQSEQYSRKSNLRVNGLPTVPNEDNDALQARVISKLSTLGVEIEERDIYRLHHASKPQPMNSFKAFVNKANDAAHQLPIDASDHTQTADVIVKFTNWSARSRVFRLHYTKNIDIRVKCDLTRERLDTLKAARGHLRTNKLNGYVYNNGECKLILVNSVTRQKQFFETATEFEKIVKSIPALA